MNSKQKHSTSAFGPLLLIGVGVVWLLSNFDILPALNWGAVLRLWPLFLILAGLNLLVQQAPDGLARFLSTLVSVCALLALGGVLFFAPSLPFVGEWFSAEVTQDHPVLVELNSAETAQIRIDTGATETTVSALESNSALLSGTISYRGVLDLDVTDSEDNLDVSLNVRNTGNWGAGLGRQALNPWQLGLSADIPIDLRLDSGSGPVELLLADLTLSNFDLDAGSGRIAAVLPSGIYDVNVDLGSGGSTFQLAAKGDGIYEFDAGSGALVLQIPFGTDARIVIDAGSGSFSADDRFTQIDSSNGDTVWQTANYDPALDQIQIEIDQGSGSVTVEPVGGR